MKKQIVGKQWLLTVLFLSIFAASVLVIFALQTNRSHSVRAFAETKAGTAGSGLNVSMTLNEDLILNFYAPQTAGRQATVTYRGEQYTLDGVANGENYKFSFDKVTPQYMTESVAVQVGDLQSSTSIQKYCEGLLSSADQLGKSALETTILQELAVDILNYGAAAQTYTSVNTDVLANGGLTEEQKGMATVFEVPQNKTAIAGASASDKVKWEEAGLVCGSKLAMYLNIRLPEGAKASDYTVTVDGTDAVYQRTTDGVATYYYTTLSVLEFDKALEAEIWNAEKTEQIGGTLTYSVNSYVESKYDSQTAGLSDMVKAIYGYGKAAAAYKSAADGNFTYNMTAAPGEDSTGTAVATDGTYEYTLDMPVLNTTDYTYGGTKLEGSDAKGTFTWNESDDIVFDVALSSYVQYGETVCGAYDCASMAVEGLALDYDPETGYTFAMNGVSLTEVLYVAGADAAFVVTGESNAKSISVEQTLDFSGDGALTVASDAENIFTVNTLRLRSGTLGISGERKNLAVKNFAMHGGVFNANTTLNTDKLVVKGGTMNIDVKSAFGYDPAGISILTTNESNQRYYFLGGTVNITRDNTENNGTKGAGAIFGWVDGETAPKNIAVAIGGKCKVTASGFSYAVIFGGACSSAPYEFSKNSAHHAPNGDVGDDCGLVYTECDNGISCWGADLWWMAGNPGYWANAGVTISDVGELQNKPLSAENVAGEVNFVGL